MIYYRMILAITSLLLGLATAPEGLVSQEDNPDASDVARLRTLLINHYALAKIRLSGPESVAALKNISRRFSTHAAA